MIDHAFLSNGYGSALISKDLNVDWLAVPRFDSSPLFCNLLDESKDCTSSIKFNTEVAFERSYINDSILLRTNVIKNKEKIASIIDFMPLAESALMRIISSNDSFEVYVKPSFNYCMIAPAVYKKVQGAIFKDPNGKQALEFKYVWNSKVEEKTSYSWKFYPGKGYLLFLYSADVGYGLFSKKSKVYSIPSEAMPAAVSYWESLLGNTNINPPAWAAHVFYSSILVILGLMYKPSGALISSPTTSLPEIIGSVRNWDYRYAWVRDSSFAAETLIKIGYVIKGREILNFLINVLDPSMKPFNHTLFTVDGGPPPSEYTADWLNGYSNSRPVRIGNAAHLQIQLDIEGEFMNALSTYYNFTKDKIYLKNVWWAVKSISKYIIKNYNKRDSGIWEERDIPKHYTHSKVNMWNALVKAAELAKELNKSTEADEWKLKADQIKEYILQNAWNEDVGSFVRFFGSKDIDASLLVMPIYGLIGIDDDRFLQTLKKIEKELVKDHLVFRYKKDFLGSVAYPFGLASYWIAKIKLMQGDYKEAEKYIRKLVSCANDLGLLGEHIDPVKCEPRGNYPHVFSHIAVLMGVYELASEKR
ncbi:MAG: glycoside hydrolase family 15 protein [Nitrososphaeria archaeon]